MNWCRFQNWSGALHLTSRNVGVFLVKDSFKQSLCAEIQHNNICSDSLVLLESLASVKSTEFCSCFTSNKNHNPLDCCLFGNIAIETDRGRGVGTMILSYLSISCKLQTYPTRVNTISKVLVCLNLASLNQSINFTYVHNQQMRTQTNKSTQQPRHTNTI